MRFYEFGTFRKAREIDKTNDKKKPSDKTDFERNVEKYKRKKNELKRRSPISPI
jgi:hypothetical protein